MPEETQFLTEEGVLVVEESYSPAKNFFGGKDQRVISAEFPRDNGPSIALWQASRDPRYLVWIFLCINNTNVLVGFKRPSLFLDMLTMEDLLAEKGLSKLSNKEREEKTREARKALAAILKENRDMDYRLAEEAAARQKRQEAQVAEAKKKADEERARARERETKIQKEIERDQERRRIMTRKSVRFWNTTTSNLCLGVPVYTREEIQLIPIGQYVVWMGKNDEKIRAVKVGRSPNGQLIEIPLQASFDPPPAKVTAINSTVIKALPEIILRTSSGPKKHRLLQTIEQAERHEIAALLRVGEYVAVNKPDGGTFPVYQVRGDETKKELVFSGRLFRAAKQKKLNKKHYEGKKQRYANNG